MHVPHLHEKLSILQSALGEYKQQGDEYLFRCPFCNHHKKKLSINLKKNAAKCWVCRWATNAVGKLINVVGTQKQKLEWSELSDSIDLDSFEDRFLSAFRDDEQENQLSITTLPDSYIPLIHSYQSEAISYLQERGVTYQDVCRWLIGYSEEGSFEGRLIFPSFDREGNVNYYVARGFREDAFPKYLTAEGPHTEIVFNDLYIDWDSPVHLVEGVFDAIKAGSNAIPLLGNHLHEDSELMSKLATHNPEIYVALDQDARNHQRSVLRTLLEYGIDCYSVDIGDFEDVGAMSKSEYQEAAEDATKITQSRMDKAILNQ